MLMNNNYDYSTSQCRSRFCKVYGDPIVGNLTFTSISSREANFMRPKQGISRKYKS